ncbi:hypothetical protein WJ0W_007177 [Paenibacillus melissococcoides]|uniref:Uncharacterized protein n=1 Tax=Paenibacillus melissococcoides TaxID=2912268 RepID=A0ABN8UFP1_9BACL|nr:MULTISPECIES: hypothetical protein [Paenibacillus]GIO81882.1 hypothetical protein J6TS7_54920 [Paenibacillus dendritiformis]CAH8248509.1 hypothetical protein WJ0W_007177 [Paenibacillus melissococcoides]CAH8722010.1 hypothetical protein HTL2_006648 [Paenibacillus melissococcoides]CAH8722050.1 hypothetical protein WDD9_006596 [Paenibacillus melissococcoides]
MEEHDESTVIEEPEAVEQAEIPPSDEHHIEDAQEKTIPIPTGPKEVIVTTTVPDVPTTELHFSSGTIVLKHEITYGQLLIATLFVVMAGIFITKWMHGLILGRYHR